MVYTPGFWNLQMKYESIATQLLPSFKPSDSSASIPISKSIFGHSLIPLSDLFQYFVVVLIHFLSAPAQDSSRSFEIKRRSTAYSDLISQLTHPHFQRNIKIAFSQGGFQSPQASSSLHPHTVFPRHGYQPPYSMTSQSRNAERTTIST